MREFDSQEERYFSYYLDELKEAGYIISYEAQPESYVLSEPYFYDYNIQLKTKIRPAVKKLIREHIYTADFKIHFAAEASGIFCNRLESRKDLTKIPFVVDYFFVSIIEIKPAFSRFNSQREFSINQKWLFQRHGVYCQKIKISNRAGLFKDTFTPKKYLVTETGKPKKLHYEPKTLEEFVERRRIKVDS